MCLCLVPATTANTAATATAIFTETTPTATAGESGDQGGDGESADGMHIVIGAFAAFVALTCAAFATIAWQKSKAHAQAAPFAQRMATNAAVTMNVANDDPHATRHVADGELYDEVAFEHHDAGEEDEYQAMAQNFRADADAMDEEDYAIVERTPTALDGGFGFSTEAGPYNLLDSSQANQYASAELPIDDGDYDMPTGFERTAQDDAATTARATANDGAEGVFNDPHSDVEL